MKRAGSKGKTTASFLALCAGLMQQKGEALNNVGSTEMRERKLDCTIGGDEGRYILMVAENLTPWSLSFIMVGELTGEEFGGAACAVTAEIAYRVSHRHSDIETMRLHGPNSEACTADDGVVERE
ncbi:uncharacterized protein LACBIDRAFT_303053 [Laccaria bicolor S238N-H82]|uniref:Predicted protein n=1 Tax=Laccaria bicolor (strain S238N-H82 / ATCC MYA-4686) TaxID=486041 RepID=B0DIV1_LACBS|nr:uncharacterized protein LACBIDRAFT_303053 [Laccaria bicolor S238N-H82]EDR05408.1 predicted protein [Laccaria bicolor S238N-H82]|eukprot:XP_001883966.1 predicted protein [Laccaria bicolor S238N-H82]